MGCLTSWTFFLCNEPFWLAHYPTKKTLWKLPKMKFSFGRWSESPLVHLYRWKDDHFGQSTCGAIRNIWGNILRTWGPCENLKRTDWEHEKVKKFNTHTRPPWKTKPWVFQMHVILPHCLGKISIPTFVCQHFQTIGGLTHESIN